MDREIDGWIDGWRLDRWESNSLFLVIKTKSTVDFSPGTLKFRDRISFLVKTAKGRNSLVKGFGVTDHQNFKFY
jgi:hypothetical protein